MVFYADISIARYMDGHRPGSWGDRLLIDATSIDKLKKFGELTRLLVIQIENTAC